LRDIDHPPEFSQRGRLAIVGREFLLNALAEFQPPEMRFQFLTMIATGLLETLPPPLEVIVRVSA
jgi:hypothetical protein